MKNRVIVIAILALLAAAVSPALAGETVSKTGWIVDEWCGEKNANADGAGCVKSCAGKGASLALFSDGELIMLDDKERALEHVGHKVVVTGVMTDEGMRVESISKADDA